MKESDFQKDLICEIEKMFPGCIILKNDPSYKKGVPDLTIFYKDKWATLEIKKSAKATHRPGQDWYVSTLDNMSFSRFIFPENKKEVLNALAQSFRTNR